MNRIGKSNKLIYSALVIILFDFESISPVLKQSIEFFNCAIEAPFGKFWNIKPFDAVSVSIRESVK